MKPGACKLWCEWIHNVYSPTAACHEDGLAGEEVRGDHHAVVRPRDVAAHKFKTSFLFTLFWGLKGSERRQKQPPQSLQFSKVCGSALSRT
jgi:hypothetical protein